MKADRIAAVTVALITRLIVMAWMGLLTWRYLMFGIQEAPMLLAFAFLTGCGMIARAIAGKQVAGLDRP